MFKRKLVSLLLITAIVSPLFYAPYSARRAQAFLGFGDLVIDVKALAREIVDGIAMTAAQQIVDRMVQSTVKWAQSGFEGNPAYVTDPQQYFTDIADGVVGEYIMSSTTLGFLCSPLQASIKISLAQQYYNPRPFQCTVTGIKGNIDNFLGDFSKGGWNTWFEVSQNPANNPYLGYIEAKIELDRRLAQATQEKEKELEWNQGFLSWSRCKTTNPQPFLEVSAVGQVNNQGTGGNLDSRNFAATGGTVKVPNPGHVKGKAVGECIERGPVETPGATIKSQLDKILPSGLEKLISANHVEQLVNAFASGLLQKFVFGPKGIFAKDNKVSNSPGSRATDIDGDGTPDGLDTDGDGALDVCYFGGADGSPSGKPCLGSGRATQTGGNGGGGGGGGSGDVTAWAWNDHGGAAFESSKCPGINPRDYFFGLVGDSPVSDWQQVMGSIEGSLWSCGIGQQKSSGGEVRGRLFLPTASCPDAAPRPGEEILGVNQNPACWTHEVDVLELSS